jgi:general secretion pathway protein E
VIGQRLVRVLCEHCKAPRRLSRAQIEGDRRFAALGFRAGEIVYGPQGCEWCGSTGFRGRQGLFEIMEVTPTIRRAIGPKTEAADLEEIARNEGMSTMIEDGVAKCRAGLTTVDEVFRVTASL